MATTAPTAEPTSAPTTPATAAARKPHKKTREERELSREVDALRREREQLQQKEAEQLQRAQARESELQKQIANLTGELEKLAKLGMALREKNQLPELALLEASTRDLVAQLGTARAKLEASTMITHPGQMAAAKPVTSSPCRVAASVATTDPNAILAQFDLGGIKPTVNDWVGLYIHDREFPNKYSLYFSTGGKPSGETTFSSLKPGTYDVRLFLAGTQVEQARSGPVLIGAAVRVIAKEVSSTKEHGPVRAFQVSWEDDKKDNDCAKDWIALFRLGTKSNKKWLTYQYCGSDPAHTLVFAAPRTPGQYEFRYFRSGSGNIYSGKSNVVIVPNVDYLELLPDTNGKIQWGCFSKEPNSGDWVGLFAKGADSTKYIQSKYCSEGEMDSDDCDSGTILFDLSQLTAGEYEFRFFSRAIGKYTPYKICPLILK